jgi:hypothetical protein
MPIGIQKLIKAYAKTREAAESQYILARSRKTGAYDYEGIPGLPEAD